MRPLPPELSEHLARETTTLCECWIVRRADDTVLGFTNHDRDLTVAGVACRAVSALDGSQSVEEVGLSSDSQDVVGVLSSVDITENDIVAGRFDNARIETWLVNWCAPEQAVHLRTAILGEITREDGTFRAELRGLTSLLDKRKGRSYGRLCDAGLGDNRCRFNVNQGNFTLQASVGNIISQTVFHWSGPASPGKNWFSGGTLTWTSGENSGLTSRIASHGTGLSTELALWERPPFEIQPGDGFQMQAGCDRTFITCREKFDNALNFQGFPHVPGGDFAVTYASEGQIHDGSPLVS